MTVYPVNKKSREAIKQNGFLTVYEGAVRSAKTVTSLIQWYRYIINSPENVFLMSGNTLGSISRNCINGDFGFIAITGGKAVPKTDTDGSKYLLLGAKKIYYCGADNHASFKKIRGMTIGGWYADEIQLHDKSFIETAFARSFASSDRVNIWTLNPDIPTHWIYKEYIDKYLEENVPGYRWFHFTLDDNPKLTEERKNEIASQFTGVFYKRYVLGLRVRGSGGCYTSFVNNKPGEEGNIIDKIPAGIFRVTVGVDFGGNKSATAFVATGWYVENKELKIITLDELYDTENKNPETLFNNWKRFVKKIGEMYTIEMAYVDSAEQLLKKGMNELNTGIRCMDAMKRAVIDRIRLADVLFAQRRKSIMRHCKHLIDAYENAQWDEKSNNESRLDNGSTNVDSLDADEYSTERDMSMLIRGAT